MPNSWPTSGSIIRRSSWMRALALWVWSSSARRRRGPRSSSVRYTYSSGFKRFYPFINFSLTHAVNTTVLCYSSSVNISRFGSYYQNIWSRHVVQEWCEWKVERPRLHRMAMEDCARPIQTCENPVTMGYNRSAAVAFATRLNHKFPFLFVSPSYKLWSECGHFKL
jgi:hypothetical protein